MMKRMYDGIIVTILMFASEIRMWNEGERSMGLAAQMNYSENACGVNRMDGESNIFSYWQWYPALPMNHVDSRRCPNKFSTPAG